MTAEAGVRLVARRVEPPSIDFIDLVSWADRGQADGRWNCELEGVNQGGVADRNGCFRQQAAVKYDDWP